MNRKKRNGLNFGTMLFGLAANLLLCAGKFAVGLLCGNIAVTADAVNNLSDAGNNVVALIAIKAAEKPADKEHPFGHERIEYVSALVVAFVVLFLGVQLVVSSVEKIILNFKEPYLPAFDLWLVYVLAASVVIKFIMFFVFKANGKKTESPVLKAMSSDSILDATATAAVLVAIVVGKFAGVNLDGYMGIAVSAVVFAGGVKVAKETVGGLIGEAPGREFVSKIEQKLLSYDGVLGAHDLIVHSYGPYNRFATVHVEVDAKSDMLAAHELIDGIERDFLEEWKIHLLIHLDPTETDNPRIEKLMPKIAAALATIDSRITFHDVRVARHADRDKILFDMQAPFDLKITDGELVARAVEGLEDTDCDVSITVDRF